VIATSPGHVDVDAGPLALTATEGEVADTPAGGVVTAQVSMPNYCTANPGGGDRGFPTYHRLVVTLPIGATRTIGGLDLSMPCGMTVTPFNMPEPGPTYAPYWVKYLEPEVVLPPAVKTGATLVYQVTLRNPLNRPISLSPCPAYIEHSSSGIKLEYQFNCASEHSIRAHGVAVFQMQMAIPNSTPSGPITVYWSVIGPGTKSCRASVEVR